jgi:hypothetical protein
MITGNFLKSSVFSPQFSVKPRTKRSFEIVLLKFDSAAEKCGATNNRNWLAYKFGPLPNTTAKNKALF